MCVCSFGQDITIKGRVTDANTSEPISFATVAFKGTNVATVTKFDGTYTLVGQRASDSLEARMVGYKAKCKWVEKEQTLSIDFQLETNQFQLSQVVINPGKNPAHTILEKVWANRKTNDIRSLKSYQFESYTKVEVDLDQLSDKLKNRKTMKPFQYLFDSLQVAAGEDGAPVLPIFISETLSDLYIAHDPKRQKEIVKATNIKAVGMEDGTFISQFVGSSFHDYNFYKNNITVLERTFISPISREAIGFYIHILEDSLWVGNKWCYQIKLIPRRTEDLVFSGTIWIQDTTFALVQSVLEIDKSANLNFVERLKIQQELTPTSPGPWVPAKTRILMDILQPGKENVGMLAKLYISNRDIVANPEFGPRFFDDQLIVEVGAQLKTQDYWLESRHEQLSSEEQTIHNIVDTVRNFPRLKTYVELAKMLSSGYFNISPKLEFGSYLLLYGTNVVEQNRFRVGFRTNEYFSQYYKVRAHIAYGTLDQRWKYGANTEIFLSRKRWNKIGYQFKHDLEGIGMPDLLEEDPLMEAAAQIGLLERLNFVNLHRAWWQMDLHRTLTQRIYFTHKTLSPE
ncbi:MAG: carboxypeptidase-like regulatory domain-containing protein, partial [Bacteroidetes bacterium]|nr:carboxypeptidase-like regulatory domain-containing protein [Bacteroidota bacterium]